MVIQHFGDVGGRILGAMPLAAKSCSSSCTAARKSHKKLEKTGKICIQATRHQKRVWAALIPLNSLSTRSISKATTSQLVVTLSCPIRMGGGRVIGLGVCCVLLEGGRPNAAVKPRYFLPHPSYVCRQETKTPPTMCFPKKRLDIIHIFPGIGLNGTEKESIPYCYIFVALVFCCPVLYPSGALYIPMVHYRSAPSWFVYCHSAQHHSKNSCSE